MALRDRLNTLRRESGSAPETTAPKPTDLAQRLERLGARGAGHAIAPDPQRREVDTPTLAAELEARVVSDHLICRETLVAPGVADTLAAGASWPLPGQAAPPPDALLFVDTETSGLAGGAGTLAFLVGLLRLEARGLVCRQYLLTGFAGEPALYRCLTEEAATAQAVVSYNGKSFDAPLLRDRACLNRQSSPLAALAHVDLLAPVRRLFGTRWPDCRLATAEARLLDDQRQDDLPGEQAPLAWFDFVHRGHTARLPGVLAHNRDDLISVAALLPLLAWAHEAPTAYGGDAGSVARAWQRHGDEPRARRLMVASESELGAGDRLELARLARRAGDTDTAVRIWHELAQGGEPRAIEALAKHYEHRVGDPASALGWARWLVGAAAAERCRRLEAKCHEAAAQTELRLF